MSYAMKHIPYLRWIASLALLIGSGHAVAADGAIAAAGPGVATDRNPDPGVVEIRLVAEERQIDLGTGDRVTMFTYNGTTPGPTIEAEVGDTLIVHFENRLPVDSTIHWHGVEVPANMDGTHLSQQPVPPGGSHRYEFPLLRAATYWYHPHIRTNEQIEMGLYGALLVRDPGLAIGLDLPAQDHVLLLDDILLGEDGQVAPPYPDDPLENAVLQVNGREGNLLLVNGQIQPDQPVERGVPQRLRLINSANTRFMRVSIAGHQLHRIAGDGGLLEAPVAVEPIGMVPDAPQVSQGHQSHGMVADAPQVSQDHQGHGMAPDAPQVSQDHQGHGMVPDAPQAQQGHQDHNAHQGHAMISDPDPSKGVLLTPGERAEIVFTPTGSEPIELEWHDIPRGRHVAFYTEDGTVGLGHDHNDGKAPPETLMRLIPVGPGDGKGDRNDAIAYASVRPATIDPLDAAGLPVIQLELGHSTPDQHGDVNFFVQRKENTGQCGLPEGMPCPLPFGKVTADDAPSVTVGETRIVEITNLTGGDHNFHLHGFFFQYLDTRFVDMDNPGNNRLVPAGHQEVQDTIRIPARPGAAMRSRTVTRVAVRFDDPGREGQVAAHGGEAGPDSSGGWIFHCHILDHAARGMMSYIQVRNPEDTAPAE